MRIFLIPCPTSFSNFSKSPNVLMSENIDIDFKDKLESTLNFNYNYSKSTITALKSSVTLLNKTTEKDLDTSYNYTPTSFSVEENTQSVNTQIGIAYHKAMQFIDFGLKNEDQVYEFLKNKLTKEEFSLVDCGKIYKAILNLQPLVEGATLYREQQFLMRIPLNQLINTDITDCVLIQGVVDLIVVKNNQIYIIDYKTSKSKNVDLTAKNYKIQLKIYGKAVEGAFKIQASQKFLYFFLQERLISFDKF